MTAVAVVRLCEALWERAGEVEPFPRDLEGLYTWALPLSVWRLPALWAADVRDWLAERGLAGATGRQRRLRACLVARDGRGVVLLDGSDTTEQRRFSLAHEAGHFLADYLEPRERLQAELGPGAVAILDGSRLPTTDERVDAILAGVALEPHVHLMERDADGLACGATTGAECRADEIALELLAPESVALAMLRGVAPVRGYAERERAAATLLRRQFGLPPEIAGGYARRLLQLLTGGPGIREWLGIA